VTRPWVTIQRVETRDGALELRRRGERDFLILLDGRILMSSAAHRSEQALASQACARLAGRANPSLLIGGLGMGFTLRAALDALPADARICVAELHACVVEWCRGVLAPLTGGAALDPRVTIELGDVGALIRRAARGGDRFDGILLDLYAGPAGGGPPGRKAAKRPRSEPKASEGGPPRSMACFEPGMLAAARAALARAGVYAVWSEQPDPAFEKRLRAAGFDAVLSRPGRGGLRHAVYTATASSS
jgi:spermidine synthase